MNNTEKAYCRLCAECKPRNKLLDIQSSPDQGKRIVNKLAHLNCQLDFNENKMPKTVCLLCINTLTSAFDFVTAIERAQEVLKSMVTSESIKIEFECFDNESMPYDSLEDKYGNNIKIKIEPLNEGTTSKPPATVKKVKARAKKEVKKDISDLDTIPLSQLDLTWKDYVWTCAFCKYEFPTVTELNQHSIECHQVCSAYRCNDCNLKKLRLERFLSHVRGHRNYLRLSCYKCLKTFSSIKLARKHKKTHINTKFLCNACNTCFPNAEELQKHTSQFNKSLRSRNPIKLQKGSLSCPVCDKIFKSRVSLRTHLLIHTDRKRDHTCEVCGKCFWSKQTLAGHMMLHEDKRPFSCEICKKAFRKKTHLRDHIGVHDGEKPFSCEQCGKCFRLQKLLAIHSVIHTDSLPHICSFCNKRFRFRTDLNQHLRQHTRVKPYSCNICERDFTNWGNYNKHMKCRHGMDMRKKKQTPDIVYPIDPVTGKVVYPDMDKILEWKNKILGPLKMGRPKVKTSIEDADSNILVPKENIETEGSNNN